MQQDTAYSHGSSPANPAPAKQTQAWPFSCCGYCISALLVLAVFETFVHRKAAIPKPSSAAFYSKWANPHTNPAANAGETKYGDDEHLEPGPMTLAAYKKISPGVFAVRNVAMTLGAPSNETRNPFGIQTDIYRFQDGEVIITYTDQWVKSVTASGARIGRQPSVP